MFSLLSQEEIANDWKTVVKKKKYKEFVETTIYLSELPPHLWNKINEDIIIDGPFKYKLNKTPHDDKIKELYNEINKDIKNINLIKELYNYCVSINISSWITIRAREIIY